MNSKSASAIDSQSRSERSAGGTISICTTSGMVRCSCFFLRTHQDCAETFELDIDRFVKNNNGHYDYLRAIVMLKKCWIE